MAPFDPQSSLHSGFAKCLLDRPLQHMKAPTFQDGAENVDVVEDGEKDEDPVEYRVELLRDEHRDGHAVADEARAADQDLKAKTSECPVDFW